MTADFPEVNLAHFSEKVFFGLIKLHNCITTAELFENMYLHRPVKMLIRVCAGWSSRIFIVLNMAYTFFLQALVIYISMILTAFF